MIYFSRLISCRCDDRFQVKFSGVPIVVDNWVYEFECLVIRERRINEHISGKFVRFCKIEKIANLRHATNESAVPPTLIQIIRWFLKQRGHRSQEVVIRFLKM